MIGRARKWALFGSAFFVWAGSGSGSTGGGYMVTSSDLSSVTRSGANPSSANVVDSGASLLAAPTGTVWQSAAEYPFVEFGFRGAWTFSSYTLSAYGQAIFGPTNALTTYPTSWNVSCWAEVQRVDGQRRVPTDGVEWILLDQQTATVRPAFLHETYVIGTPSTRGCFALRFTFATTAPQSGCRTRNFELFCEYEIRRRHLIRLLRA